MRVGKNFHTQLFQITYSARYWRKQNKLDKKKWDSLCKATRKQEKLIRLAGKKGIKLPMDTVAFLQQYADLLPRDSISKEDAFKMGEKALSKMPPKQRQELEGLKMKFGPQSGEVKLFYKALHDKDSASKQKLSKEALKQAKDKSIAALPPAHRKQLEQLQKEYGPYSKEASGYLGFLKDSVKWSDTLKVVATQKAEAIGTQLISQQLGGDAKQLTDFNKQLTEMKGTVQQYQKQMAGYQDSEKLKSEGKAKAKEQALERAAGLASKIQALSGPMTKLKNKYSSLLNSDDLSTGIKANSLKGRPLRERWVLGGNFNVTSTAPLMIDLSPQVGYKIDKRFQAGIGGIYRAKFVDTVGIANSISPSRYGFTSFASYGLLLNFFAYAEWEHTKILSRVGAPQPISTTPVPDPPATKQWVDGLLIGVGRQFIFHPKVKGSVLFLWNPLHKNGNSPYHEAFVVKTGFQLSELAMLKKK